TNTTDCNPGIELGALAFDSCTPAAGVISCTTDSGNSNHLLITFAGGGERVSSVFPGTLVATINAHFVAGQQGGDHPTGRLLLVGNTTNSQGGGLSSPAGPGSAGGSAPLFYPAPPPAATLTKTCAATFTGSSVSVHFTATLTNTGTFEGLNSISCTDVPVT